MLRTNTATNIAPTYPGNENPVASVNRSPKYVPMAIQNTITVDV